MRVESVALLASAAGSVILALLVLTTMEAPARSFLTPRGVLAKTLFERLNNDKAVEQFDKNKVRIWFYFCPRTSFFRLEKFQIRDAQF